MRNLTRLGRLVFGSGKAVLGIGCAVGILVATPTWAGVVTINMTGDGGGGAVHIALPDFNNNGVFLENKVSVIGGVTRANRLVVANATGAGNAVYATTEGGGVYEVSTSDGATFTNTLVNSTGGTYGINTGDSDNNSTLNIVYGYTNGIEELEWNGSSFTQTSIKAGTGSNVNGVVVVPDTNANSQNETASFWANSQMVAHEYNGASYSENFGKFTGLANYTDAAGGVDVDNDGLADAVVVSDGAGVLKYDFATAGTGTEEVIKTANGQTYKGVSIGNIDNDANVEIVTVSSVGTLISYEWNGANWIESVILTGLGSLTGVDLFDIDGDGFDEIFAVNDGGVLHYIDSTGTGFAPLLSYQVSAAALRDVKVGDIGLTIPEPASVALLSLGVVSMLGSRRRTSRA